MTHHQKDSRQRSRIPLLRRLLPGPVFYYFWRIYKRHSFVHPYKHKSDKEIMRHREIVKIRREGMARRSNNVTDKNRSHTHD